MPEETLDSYLSSEALGVLVDIFQRMVNLIVPQLQVVDMIVDRVTGWE